MVPKSDVQFNKLPRLQHEMHVLEDQPGLGYVHLHRLDVDLRGREAATATLAT
jgi:hypothetical protein